MSVAVIPIFMLFFGLFVAIVAMAGRRRPASGRRPVVAIGLAVGLSLAMVLLGLLFSARTVSSSQVRVASAQTLPLPSPLPPASFEWNQAMAHDPALPRDPHTSIATLKAYMAASIETALSRPGNDEGGRARKVWVIADEKVPQGLVSGLRRDLKAELSKSQSRDFPETDAVVRLRWDQPPTSESVSWLPQRMLRGTLVADVKAPRIDESVRARFEEKPWLDRPTVQYGDFKTLVVTSGQPTAATREEAVSRLNQAKSAAVSNLVEAQVAALAGQWHTSPDDVRSQVQARYGDAGNAYDDQVVQKIDGPHGRVWYAAGVVRVPSDGVMHMAQSAQHVSHDRRAGWAKMIGGAAGMLLVLLVAYAIMNAITRGYFRGHLRAAVAIVMAVAVVAMFLSMA